MSDNVTILKPGDPVEKRKWFICPECHCEFTATKDICEMTVSYSGSTKTLGMYQYPCPNCGVLVTGMNEAGYLKHRNVAK